MKEYRLSNVVLLLMTVIVVCSTKCISRHSITTDKQVSLLQPLTDIDLPLPLSNSSEQILYRKGYVVSYNKETKIPNWVAWHLTAEHARGTVRRPNNAWHEDMDVPSPRATSAVNSFNFIASLKYLRMPSSRDLIPCSCFSSHSLCECEKKPASLLQYLHVPIFHFRFESTIIILLIPTYA